MPRKCYFNEFSDLALTFCEENQPAHKNNNKKNIRYYVNIKLQRTMKAEALKRREGLPSERLKQRNIRDSES